MILKNEMISMQGHNYEGFVTLYIICSKCECYNYCCEKAE